MSIDKDRVVLKTAFSAPEAENPTTELKGLELILSDVDFDVSLDYDLTKRIWDQLDLRMRIRLTTEDLQEELPDCVITASVQKQDKCWQIIGEVEALHFASLAMLLPLNGRETMIQMMGRSMLLDLKAKYKMDHQICPLLTCSSLLGWNWILSTNIRPRVNGRYMRLWLQIRNLLHRNDGTTVPNQGTVPNSTGGAIGIIPRLF